MFSGIVEEIGAVRRVARTAEGIEIEVGCQQVLEGTIVGDSIAVEGVCITVSRLLEDGFLANVQPVTARLSTLGSTRPGIHVNLERALAAGQRMGGHYVQGHIDGRGTIRGLRGEGASLIVDLSVPDDLQRYIVERGFIAIDGASLTIMSVEGGTISVSLVYHTQQHLTLPAKKPGDPVNIEVDVIAKYVERLVQPYQSQGMSLEALRRAGFA